MPNISLHTKDTAPENSRKALELLEDTFGFAPNIFRQMAEAPAALGGTLQLIDLLDNCSLSPAQRWVTLLVTAGQNTSHYCMAANSTMAHIMGVSNEIVEAVRENQPFTDPSLEALRTFVIEIIQQRSKISPESRQAFIKAGHSNAQLLDVILAIGLETIASYTTRVFETPVDSQFQGNIWSKKVYA